MPGMSNPDGTEPTRYPVWQLTDGTIVVQSLSDADQQAINMGSVRASDRSKSSMMRKVRHRVLSVLESL